MLRASSDHRRWFFVSVLLLVSAAFAAAGWGVNQAHGYLEQKGFENIELYFSVLNDALQQKGRGFRVVDGNLLIGDHVVSGDAETPDRVKAITKATVSIFVGEIRTATSVHRPDGTRAVGVTFNAGPYVHDLIYKQGKPYRGYVLVQDRKYFVGYNPIIGATGGVIGSMAVGRVVDDYFDVIERIQSLLFLGALAAPLLGGLVLWRWGRRKERRAAIG